jgi:hypothetical protein
MEIIIRGSCPHVSKRFIKAWIYSTIGVLAFHGYHLDGPITFRLLPPTHKKFQPTENHPLGTTGRWIPHKREVLLMTNRDAESLGTTILHELIHALLGPFPKVLDIDGEWVDTEEKCTSTLTARLKPSIDRVALAMMDKSQSRAAFLAHTKISYRNKRKEDWYDQDQYKKIGVSDPIGEARREGYRKGFMFGQRALRDKLSRERINQTQTGESGS